MGRSLSEWVDVDLPTCFVLVGGYFKGIERQNQLHWETTRQIVWATFQTSRKREIDPKKILKLPWDKKPKKTPQQLLTLEEIDKQLEIAALKNKFKSL